MKWILSTIAGRPLKRGLNRDWSKVLNKGSSKASNRERAMNGLLLSGT